MARIRVYSDDGLYLGTAARVLDLANPEPDPQVRIIPLGHGESITIGPWQPCRVGHVIGNVLDAAAIYTNGTVIPPEDAGVIDAECADCDSSLAVLPHQERGCLWFVVEHSRTCPAMAQWIRDQR